MTAGVAGRCGTVTAARGATTARRRTEQASRLAAAGAASGSRGGASAAPPREGREAVQPTCSECAWPGLRGSAGPAGAVEGGGREVEGQKLFPRASRGAELDGQCGSARLRAQGPGGARAGDGQARLLHECPSALVCTAHQVPQHSSLPLLPTHPTNRSAARHAPRRSPRRSPRRQPPSAPAPASTRAHHVKDLARWRWALARASRASAEALRDMSGDSTRSAWSRRRARRARTAGGSGGIACCGRR